MKNLRLLTLFVVFSLIYAGTGIAQVSYGGKPISFDKKLSVGLQKSLPTVTMNPVNVNLLQAEDLANENNKDIPWRFGQNIDVNINAATSGQWEYLPNGDRLWRVRIYSPGALSLNFGFSKYHLPDGAKLFFYNENHSEVLGSFTSANNIPGEKFATTLIPGEAITIEYYEPADAVFSGELIIDRVTHGYRNVFDFAAKAFGGAGACQRNVACSPDSIGWSNQIRSVCMLVVGGSGFCTGALINNTAQDATPYVLTANHCSTSNDFASWIFWFNWQSATCTNPGTSPAHDQVTTGGCTLKARNAGSDFCLVQMNATPPCTFNPYYSGWSRSTTPATSAAGIHHPSGDIKKISLSTQAAVSATYSGATCWQIFWGTTCTEPGSSGSPIYDQNHRIIGQLYGGPSACGAAPGSMNDYYGQLAVSWAGGGTSATRLSDWLDPLGTAPQTLDGYDPCAAPPVTLDAELTSITEPVSTYCSAQSIVPTVVIKNNGSTTLTSLTVSYNIDGGTNVTQNWTGSLITTQSATVTFPAITLTMGTHTFNASCTSPNGGTDLNTANDTKSISYSVSSGSTLPFQEGFENTTFPPANWTFNNPDGATTWARAASSGNGASTASAFMDFYNYNAAGETDDLITPALDFPAGASIQMTFNVAYRQYAAETDQLQIFVSTDCGVTYNPTAIYDKAGSALATLAASTTAFVPNAANNWRLETLDLSAYAGNSVKLKFVSTTQYGNNLYVDDINIQSLTTPPVADFTSSLASPCGGAVQFTDLSTNNPTSWLWDFGDGQTSTLQNPSHNYSANGTYTITLTATNNFGNDQIVQANLITINMPVSPTATGASRCGTGTLNLSASGAGTLHWFDAPTAGTDLGTGTTFTTPNLSATTTYYVEDQIIQPSQYVGPLSNFATGQYSNTSYTLIFDCLSPITLVSVAVDKQTAGNITIQLTDAGGAILQTGSFAVPTGASRVTLNWPVATGTGLRLVGPANAGLWRVNTPGTYPYTIAGLINITGCSSGTRYGSYFDWEVKEPDCMSARVPVVATVNAQVTPTITINASSTTICPGDNVTFTATTTNGGITPSYQWQLNGANVGPNSPTVTTSALSNNDIATCVLTSSESCVTASTATSNAVTITVSSAAPVAGFTYTSNQLDFSFTSTSTGATSYLWDFGDGTTSTTQNPIHTYATSGMYVVTLTVTSNCGTNNVIQSVNAVGSGISTNNLNSIMNIYPNPTHGTVNVSFAESFDNGNIIIENSLGQVVYSGKINQAKNSVLSFDLRKLSEGIYMIRVSNADVDVKHKILYYK